MLDVLIKSGLVVDGSGGKAFFADVAIKDGKIRRIAPNITLEAHTTIDATGKVVSPGFIDNHTHGDYYCLFGTDAYHLLEQGVTTEIAGNCGGGILPYYDGLLDSAKGMVPDALIEHVRNITRDFRAFSEGTKDFKMGTNMALYAPHGNIRASVMGFSPDKPTPTQLKQMKSLMEEAMQCGFLGLSTGLIYPPSVYADRQELIELCSIVAQYHGCYSSHIRGECDTVVEAVAEAISIGEESGCDVVISHHKIGGLTNRGKSTDTLRLIQEANERGTIRVRIDQYPYIAGQTALIHTLPEQFAANGIHALIEQLKDPVFRNQVGEVMFSPSSQSLLKCSGFDGCLILVAPKTPDYVGKTIAEIAGLLGRSPIDVTFDLLVENSGDVDAAYFYQNEEDMLTILAHSETMAGADVGHNLEHYDHNKMNGAHPRGMSTFPKRLRMVRESNMFSLEEEIRRICYLPAQTANIDGIGLLLEGYQADICVFDWQRITENNDFMYPFKKNTGIDTVIVRGQIAVTHGEFTGIRAGMVLKKRT